MEPMELQRIAELRAEAKAARDDGRPGDAIALLGPLATELEEMLRGHDPASPASSVEQRVAGELAETYGLLGSAHRDAGDHERALGAYDRGWEIEAGARYGLVSTYNAINRVVTRIVMAPERLSGRAGAAPGAEEVDVPEELDRLAARLSALVDGPRAADPWAAGDLALVEVLRGAAGAEAWDRFLDLAPPWAVRANLTTVSLLADLDTPRQEALEASRRRLGEHAP